jgi:hypothetical protein
MSAVNSALLVASTVDLEESAQSILERHVSRVFDSPDAQQTPTRSMDCHSLVGVPTNRSICTDHQMSGDVVKYISNKIERFDENAKMVSAKSCTSAKGGVNDIMLQSRTSSLTFNEQTESRKPSESIWPGTNHGCEDIGDTAQQQGFLRLPNGGIMARHQQLLQQPVCNHSCAKDK